MRTITFELTEVTSSKIMEPTRVRDSEKDPESVRFIPGPVAGSPKNLVVSPKTNLPPGISILRRCLRPLRVAPLAFYQFYILVITYMLYVFYHISRKPLSVVKNVLHRNCSTLATPAHVNVDSPEIDTWCNWVPFEGSNYKELYATLDFTYLMAYAIAMFFVGAVAERTNLRYFLSCGMIMAGFLTILFGLGHVWEIHHFSFFVGVQLIGGALQATGFPSVVAVVGNWLGKKRRGMVFGIWNSHASLGNILGSLLASVWVDRNWGLSFMVPGLTIIVGGVIAFLFVIVQPEDAGFPPQNVYVPEAEVLNANGAHELDQIAEKESVAVAAVEDRPIKFWEAVLIPGVIEYSTCMFFAKGVAYTFLVWLPVYIRNTMEVRNDVAGYLSTFFDLGGIVGGIIVGAVSDWTGARGVLCGVLMFVAVPVMLMLLFFGASSLAALIVLLIITGLVTVGPYSTIATAVSADLGTSLKGKSKALSTVSGIVNGMGSFGAAFGPLLTGMIAARGGWAAVFYFLISAQLVAALCLCRIVHREVKDWSTRQRKTSPH